MIWLLIVGVFDRAMIQTLSENIPLNAVSHNLEIFSLISPKKLSSLNRKNVLFIDVFSNSCILKHLTSQYTTRLFGINWMMLQKKFFGLERAVHTFRRISDSFRRYIYFCQKISAGFGHTEKIKLLT